MGALNCCGRGGRKPRRGRSRLVHSTTTEPLLRESEREAVSSLLRYLEEGREEGRVGGKVVLVRPLCLFFGLLL